MMPSIKTGVGVQEYRDNARSVSVSIRNHAGTTHYLRRKYVIVARRNLLRCGTTVTATKALEDGYAGNATPDLEPLWTI